MRRDDPKAQNLGLSLAPIVFTCTIFLSAALLFFVQPLFAKTVLPLIGGTPAVWTTAMLFFQSALIAGYLYAHLISRYLTVTAQVALHAVLWACALFFLPLTAPADWQFNPDQPLAWQTLMVFTSGVGVPFAVLAANAPLIQNWYRKSGGASADDPYFLYGASNLGSLVALIAFPLLAEPLFGATQIGIGWALGFVLLGGFLFASGTLAQRGRNKAPVSPRQRNRQSSPPLSRYAFWLFLAFVPSSLMLAVTTKISTDLGSFPLLWIIPLALFLLTFVLTFTQRPIFGDRTLHYCFLTALAVFGVVLSGVMGVGLAVGGAVAVVVAFFFVSLRLHRALYIARPDAAYLTVFYLTMSVGGAMGGLFNAIVARAVFVHLEELPVTVILAAAVLLVPLPPITLRLASVAALTLTIVLVPVILQQRYGSDDSLPIAMAVIFGLTLTGLLFGQIHKSIGFVMVAGLLAVGSFATSGTIILEDRSFFGTHRIVERSGLRLYQNGTTVHGAQRLDDLASNVRPTPLYYYHPSGPMGQVFQSTIGRRATDIGVVGLGVGALACYRRPDQDWQFYEIDALVDDIARNPAYFTYLSHCAPDAPTHLGDARIVLAAQTEQRFDILVIDAYSSDAVPIHLTTSEAVALYRDRLKDGGIIVLHISNRYYDLAGPLARSADALGLSAKLQIFTPSASQSGASASHVIVMALDPATLNSLHKLQGWETIKSDGERIWTDDYTNVLSALR